MKRVDLAVAVSVRLFASQAGFCEPDGLSCMAPWCAVL